jgi:hypothetical protein
MQHSEAVHLARKHKIFPRRAQVIDTATLRGLLSP